MKRLPRGILAAIGIIAAGPASANVGVPMVAIFLPPLWLSLLPVIFVEAWILSKRLHIGLRSSLAGATIGNLVSTVIGIPLMWVVIASFQLAFAGEAHGLSTFGSKVYATTVQAPWLIPYESQLRWMIPVALVVLSLPAFALSVVIEWLCFKPFVKAKSVHGSLRAVAVANACSYLLLALLFAGVLAAGQRANKVLALFEPVSMSLAEAVFTGAGWLVGQPAR